MPGLTNLFGHAPANVEGCRGGRSRFMKKFRFCVKLVGSGKSADEAWEVAKAAFFSDDEGVPEPADEEWTT